MPAPKPQKAKNGFKAATIRIRAATAEGVRATTLDLLREAVQRAPFEDGELRGSASAHHNGERIGVGADVIGSAQGGTPMEGGLQTTELTGAVMFNTIYAAAQHERTDQAHPQGGEAKYLANAAVAVRKRLEENIGERVRKEVGR